MRNDTKFFTCPNCGGEVPEGAALCPFCGSSFEEGQERKYRENLEDIREDTENLYKEELDEYKDSAKSHVKTVFKITMIIVLILIAGIVLVSVMNYAGKSGNISSSRTQLEFQEKYFDELDELFAAGDDEAVIERLNELYGEKGSDALYNWDHWTYFNYYMIGVGIEDVISDIEEGKADKVSLSSGIYDALVLEFAENDADYKNYSSKMTQREKDNFAAWKENAEKLLKDKLGYTDSDIKQMYEECSPDGYLSYTKVSEKGQEFLERAM